MRNRAERREQRDFASERLPVGPSIWQKTLDGAHNGVQHYNDPSSSCGFLSAVRQLRHNKNGEQEVVEEERAKCSSITVQRIYLTVELSRLTGRPVFKWPVNFSKQMISDLIRNGCARSRPFVPDDIQEHCVLFITDKVPSTTTPKMATSNPASLNGKVLMEIDQETLDSGACG